MRQAHQFVYILLYLQLFICNGFIFADVSSKKIISNVKNKISINEQKCNSDDECTVTDSVCSNGLCKCAPGYILSADLTSCIKVATGLNAPCNETAQCSAYLFSGAQCVKDVCVCGPGYYYLHGKCNRYVGLFEKCKKNIDCYVNAEFEASICDTIDGICKCNSDFYQREHRTCRRKGKAVNDECILDIDCTFINATCTSEYVCAIKSESDKAVAFSSDAVLNISDTVDKEIQVSKCKTDEDCKALENTICDPTGICRCKRAHFVPDAEKDTKCIPELGESCQEYDVNDHAYIEKSICRKGKWSCTNGTVATKDNRKCRKGDTDSCVPILSFGESCSLDIQCSVNVTDAICASKNNITDTIELPKTAENKTCTCSKENHYKFGKCFKKKFLGETCANLGECYETVNQGIIVCKKGKCACDSGYMKFDNSTCVRDTQSPFLSNGSVINGVPTELFLIVLFIFSCKLI
nr:PREDICTED: prion-like-(Q/N-rich) domain-bearing protein 25 [Linepithema humile]